MTKHFQKAKIERSMCIEISLFSLEMAAPKYAVSTMYFTVETTTMRGSRSTSAHEQFAGNGRITMYALRFKFEDSADGLPAEAFVSVLTDLVNGHRYGFPILRTQVYYPDSSDLNANAASEFMIEVLDENALRSLRRFLQNRTDVDQVTVQEWHAAEAFSPLQKGIWCYTYHAGHLRLAPEERQPLLRTLIPI